VPRVTWDVRLWIFAVATFVTLAARATRPPIASTSPPLR
jgi:hypothetical protein